MFHWSQALQYSPRSSTWDCVDRDRENSATADGISFCRNRWISANSKFQKLDHRGIGDQGRVSSVRRPRPPPSSARASPSRCWRILAMFLGSPLAQLLLGSYLKARRINYSFIWLTLKSCYSQEDFMIFVRFHVLCPALYYAQIRCNGVLSTLQIMYSNDRFDIERH